MPMITRTDAEALIPVEVSREIMKNVSGGSAVLPLMKKLPNLTAKQRRIPVLASLAVAGFVTGDDGLKSVTTVNWDNVFINAEEIAVIIPIPEAVLDDADYDIWGEVKPQIVDAFGRVIDGALAFGTNRPTAWPEGLVPSATAAGHVVARGTGLDIADDVGGEDGLMALVEADGFNVNGFAGDVSIKSAFRGLRDKENGLLYQPSLQVGTPGTLYGQQINFVTNGAWDKSKALMIGGDWSQAVYAFRQDMTYKLLDQAVISDAAGKIIYNLAQQDMVALRCVMRLGWALPNPINAMNPNKATRFPFAVLK